YHAIAEEAAPRMAQVPGLEAKWWWVDAKAARAGGVYTFESVEAADQYLAGPIVSGLREAWFCEGVQTRVTDLLEPRPAAATSTELFAQRVLGDLSASMTGVMVRLGHELGLYRALGEHGALTSQELAEHA